MPKPSRVVVALAALLLGLFGSSLLHAAPKSPATGSLLVNPDFERGLSSHPWMPSGWDTSRADLPTVFFGRDSFLVHKGQWAVNVANMSTTFPMAHNWSQTILVGPQQWGKTAVFRMWTRSNGLEGRAYILVQAYQDTASKMARIWGVDHDEALTRLGIHKIDDPLLDIGWQRVSFDEALTDWVPREARAYVPPGCNVLIVRGGIMGTGQVLFDDASLTFEPAPVVPLPKGENLFREPGFENRGLAWDLAIPPFEGAKVRIDSTVAHSGRASLTIEDFHDGLVEARIGAGQPFDGRALRGQRVRLSGWYKGDSLDNTCYVKIYAHGLTSRVTQSPGGELLSGSWDWKPLSIELDVPDDAVLVWANLLVTAPARGQVWIDDGRFEIIGPARSKAAATTAKPAAAAPAGRKPKKP